MGILLLYTFGKLDYVSCLKYIFLIQTLSYVVLNEQKCEQSLTMCMSKGIERVTVKKMTSSVECTLQLFSQKDLGRRAIGRCVFTSRGDGFFSNCSIPGKILVWYIDTLEFSRSQQFPDFL